MLKLAVIIKVKYGRLNVLIQVDLRCNSAREACVHTYIRVIIVGVNLGVLH